MLNYALLNSEQTISLSLEDYFTNPVDVKVDDSNSTEDVTEILKIQLSKEPITNISSVELVANMSENTTMNFNDYEMLMERSIYNHPIKVFLMNKNVIFSLRYQISHSDNLTSFNVYQVAADNQNCQKI